MSQKKPTTNQQLEEMRAMIENLEPGKVVTLDRELQQRNTTLMLMLYGATAKYGISMANENGVLVTAQIPVLQVPANQSLQWEVSEDGKTVMMYIVLNELKLVDEAPAEAGGEDGAMVSAADESQNISSLTHIPRYDGDGEIVNPAPLIGDEFEDEIVVGLSDAEEEHREMEMNHGD